MQGKKGCYWGFGTTNNVVAWIAALGFVVAGAALLATGINTVNGCSEKYKACRAANGPLSDVDTDKCVPVLAVCAKPGIGQYTAGAVLLACVALPAFYFCCCAVRPDKQQVHPSGATVSPGAVGDKKQSIDCEKQGVSQQELIGGDAGGPQVYKYEYQPPSASTYVINSMKQGQFRNSMSSEHSSQRQLALFPSRTMSVFGPDQEPSRNFNEVRATEAVEVPSSYHDSSVALHRQGSMLTPRSREAAAAAAAATSPRRVSNPNGSEQSFGRSNSARSIKPFNQTPPPPHPETSQMSSGSGRDYYQQRGDDSYNQGSPRSGGRHTAPGSSSPSTPSTPKIAPVVFHQPPVHTPKRIPSFYDRL